ncbi:MAG: ribosome silencing factor [Balneolia bacterium]|nr:ribosome silencing factor [Balneolia bacterium]
MTEPNTDSSFNTEGAKELINTITSTLSRRKAEQILVMDLREITTLADYFVVCNGLSDVHVKSLADELTDVLREELNERPWRKEGLDTRRWVVLDFVNIVVHIFKKDTREHYGIEKMWSDAKVTKIED